MCGGSGMEWRHRGTSEGDLSADVFAFPASEYDRDSGVWMRDTWVCYNVADWPAHQTISRRATASEVGKQMADHRRGIKFCRRHCLARPASSR